MRLRSVSLKNVRSYVDETVQFPEGNVLLAGDIGSGKSTILMAIDFALFGLTYLSGSDLLRHGANMGSVTLDFTISGKNVRVKRSLKRSGGRISQTKGTMSLDGRKNEYMPTEISAAVAGMMGYPEKLSKSQPMFSFTVYTPQEEMKNIMFNDSARLDILRKVFDVEKYGTIRENARMFLTEMRAMKRELEAESRDLNDVREQLAEYREQKKTAADKVKQAKKDVEIHKEKIFEKKDKIKSVRESLRKINEMKQKRASLEAEKKTLAQALQSANKEIQEAKKQLESDIPDTRDLKEIREDLSGAEEKRDQLLSEKAKLENQMNDKRQILEKGECGVCGQPVSDRAGYEKHIKGMENRFSKISEEIARLNKKLTDLKKERDGAKEAEMERRTMEKAREALEKRKNRKREFLERLDKIEEELSGMDIAESSSIEEKLSGLEKEINGLNSAYTEASKRLSKYEQMLEGAGKSIDELGKRGEKMKQARKKSKRVSRLTDWMSGRFVPMVESTEKHVLASIQREFNQHFQEWFSLLVEDLSVRVDDTFTPIIEQNNYETEYSNLSGGEKTSVALAYRLALNKVINKMVETIRTKDLLILDEPTDGFSTDQLDRIRDILDRLDLGQVVIVSHEPKIDTYVDHVVRIFKENHVSRVAG